MQTQSEAFTNNATPYAVRELVCIFRPARDHEGRIVQAVSIDLTDARAAVRVLGPFMADQAVETFGVACISAKYRLLAWHVLSRGTRGTTLISIPDVFVPACVTPGTVALLVAHNHPSGDPTPSPDDVALTKRLLAAADILDVTLFDHLIVGEDQRYFSFREHGLVELTP